ncbi:MAG: FAD-dependent oxidoreductase, partial [Urechidicola sp.]|nr:FAD-dependent oxidoreductase [Urechidicola sp.]
VLEKNNQYGGNLQTFVRDKSIFDTGVHYIGSLGEGQNLNPYFKYLGIMDELKLLQLDDNFDVITFDNDDKEYVHSQGYKDFVKSLVAQFPDEKEAINCYCNKMQEVCKTFPLYNLDGKTEGYDKEALNIKISDYLDSITDNVTLKAVLAGSNFLYAGKENTPLYVHALSVNSFIKSSWRCVNGGSQISKQLIRKIKEFGGEVYKHHEVVKFGFKNDELDAVITKEGKVIKGDLFISNIEPKQTIKMLNGKGIRKAYANRIDKVKSMISGFSIHIVFKPETFKYLNYNYYHFKDPERVWKAQDYSDSSWPEAYLVSMGVRKNQDEWAENLTAMTYMRYDEVAEWEDTFNTVAQASERGDSYEEFKNKKTEQFLVELEKKFPTIRSCIKSIHTASPLSYRDYIGSNEGAMYGYVKDADNPMMSFLSPKTKSNKLFFTGQSVNMHGILGVTISGVLTCSHIIGKEKLLDAINKSLVE